MIKAVLFDLDGTLCDSLADLAAATDMTLRRLGFPGHSFETYRYFVGNGIPKLIERALPEDHRSADEVERARQIFLSCYGEHFADRTTVYEGMPELIDRLKSAGIRLAVCTNKAQKNAELVVKTFYGDRFDLIVGQRDGLPVKPDPTAARQIMAQFSVTPDECVFLGDSGVDMKTAVACGALPVGALWGYRDRDELEQNGAVALIKKPSELWTIINGGETI